MTDAECHSELTNVAEEVTARHVGCTVTVLHLQASRCWMLCVFGDGAQIADLPLYRAEMIMSKPARRKLMRERLRKRLEMGVADLHSGQLFQVAGTLLGVSNVQ